MRSSYGRPAQRRGLPLPLLGGVLVLLLALVVGQLCRGVPALSALPAPAPPATTSDVAPFPWPTTGPAAIGLADVGVLGSSNDAKPVPLASVTKMMTALVILDGHPLKDGESGPTLTISHADVVDYLRQAGEDQSVVPIAEGETITQRQLLEGVLIASGNNMAEILARWDAGSVEAFVAKMNAKAQALGMTQTRYADPSGISPASTGTAADQVRLALAAMRNPAFAQIVAMPSADLPVAGTIHTTNRILGRSEVVGIKTGSTDEAGGCFVFASMQTIGGQRRLVVGAVLGQQVIGDAFEASTRLADAAPASIRPGVVVSSGASVGTVTSKWGRTTEVRPAQDVTLLLWPGAQAQTRTELETPSAPLAAGAEVGSVIAEVGGQRVSVPARAVEALPGPGLLWRLLRY